MRKTLFKIHSYLGLTCLFPFLLICLTGSLLVFKFELDSLLMPGVAALEQAEGERLPADILLANINQRFPDYEMGSWEIFDDHHEADRIYLIKKGTSDWFKVFMNPYTGEALSEPVDLHHYLTDWLLELHYTLLLNDLFEFDEHLGTLFTSLFAIFLLGLGITGLVIYRKFWQRFFTLRWDARMTVFFSDLHKMIGIIASPVLIILAITGGYFNISIYVHETLEHTDGEEHHIVSKRLYNDKLSLDTMLTKASSKLDGFNTTYILFPTEPDYPFTMFGRVPTNILLSNYASTVSFDAQTGDVTASYDIREQSFLAAMVDSFRRLHFGHFGGLLTKVIWSVLGFMPIVLGITGVTLWANRKNKRRKAKESRSALRQALQN